MEADLTEEQQAKIARIITAGTTIIESVVDASYRRSHSAQRAEKTISDIVSSGKTVLVALVDFIYDHVMKRLAEDRPIAPVMYVYPAAYKPDKDGYAGGETGVAVLDADVPVTIIDLIAVAKVGGFSIDQFYVNDQNMLMGCSDIPADMFFPQAMNRGVRFTKLEARKRSTIHFHNCTIDPTPLPFMVAAKVRSEFLPDAFYPSDGQPTAYVPE